MSRGHVCLVLHAHMPFIRHPEHEDFLEEGWLREAILETYIPLLWQLEALAERGIEYRITISLSPTLVAMLMDPLLCSRFERHLGWLCDLSEREVRRTRHQPLVQHTANLYRERFARARQDYTERWQGNLVAAFRRLSDAGKVELITCSATHGFLPLMNQNPLAVRAQILVGVQHHRERFGQAPKGLWLPECGYFPGLDRVLADAGIGYTFVETHAIDHAPGQAYYGVYAPLTSPSGVACFGRDPESTEQVWSSTQGYPGDPYYREYYRDVGFELDAKALGPLAHPLGIRRNVGIKYHRVTGRTEAKEPYVHERALERAEAHGRDFFDNRRAQVDWLAARMDRRPIVVAPYDAELFGHWWFEGPDWLGHVLEKVANAPADLSLLSPSDYLAAYPVNQLATPSASSWGYKGYNEMWLNGKNDWIYPHLHEAADRMVALARAEPNATGSARRALNQAARELLLAQASDWAFIMSQGTVVSYAEKRTKDHLSRFRELESMLRGRSFDDALLADLEARDNLFPKLDYRVYRADFGARA